MINVLFSRPEHDIPIAYLFYYSKELVKLSKLQGYNTINKEREEANKTNILSIIDKVKPKLIMFNGHGDIDLIMGHKDEVIISARENPQVLANTITYALSCSSAVALGPESVKKGTICFIGYESDFALARDPNSEAAPAKDKIARLFLEPSNALFASLLEGKAVKYSIKKAKKKMVENLWYLNTTKDFPEAPHLAPYLFGNYISLTACGNENASIND